MRESLKGNKEATELDEAIDFRKAFMDIQSYAKKSGGIDKTDFEKVAYYVKAIGDNQNTPNVANKAFMAMKKHIAGHRYGCARWNSCVVKETRHGEEWSYGTRVNRS